MAKNLEIALLFDFYGDMLTEKQRDVVELYYDNDLSLSEIARLMESRTPWRVIWLCAAISESERSSFCLLYTSLGRMRRFTGTL